ncbi:hypothetical protein [Dyella telluris]|uniref:Uncharacterized protein n=1 Tax=Dyella telluris TaxID=2763498 RepID=A0A7G8PZD2_9GAMM|nr:hypothetical protein [Dyella telluris]QNJ99889.1 hypothetical protein H8F01_12140 [Dyella telluris]
MQRLSSRWTFFYKRLFPLFWFGMIAMSMTGLWAAPAAGGRHPDFWLMLLPPLFMAVVVFVLFKTLIFDLVDEVWLQGDHLLVTSRGDQVSVALDNVMNVSSTTMTNPPRISLTLRTESSRLGKTVSFMPVRSREFFAMFKPNPIASLLIERVDAARRRPA